MSLLVFIALCALLFSAALAALFVARFSTLNCPHSATAAARAGRYRPMLRLLSEKDLAPVRGDKRLLRRVRAERNVIFRGYLRCLALDYSRLLAGLRLAALESAVDRPDLARAVLRHRMLFAMLLCRVDVLLFLHRFGIRGLDVSGVVETLDSIRIQTTEALAPTAALEA